MPDAGRGAHVRAGRALRRHARAAIACGALLACPGLAPAAVSSASVEETGHACPTEPGAGLQTRRFAFEGRCKTAEDTAGCAYHDLRELDPDAVRGVDQRGVTAHQVTFPGEEHLWAALAVNRPPESRFCWTGGAIVGRNPLAMTWSTPSGSKPRKNNFLLTESGRVVVEGARVHNVHDAFLAAGKDAGFDIRHSWITWNRDDLFEGYLHDLRIADTLVDGTYTFLSDPDGDCDADKAAHDRVVVIEDSLIRLQRQPGPYAAHTPRWHLDPRGGHNTLWKLDSCGWEDWPRFVLRGNVFLVEGPRTTRRELDRIDCRLALPGDCDRPLEETLAECDDNLFLYTDYHLWTDADAEPGPVPRPGSAFHEPDNPSFLPNGRDCYQRLTDDPRDAGYADVRGIWNERRARWIERHTGAEAAVRVARIPGVDHAPFASEAPLVLENRSSGTCLTSPPRGAPAMRRCDGSAGQRFTAEPFDDGKLVGALLLRDARGRVLRTPPPPREADADVRDWPVLAEAVRGERPTFAERWYLLPLDAAESGAGEPLFAVESDVIGRSFLRVGKGDRPVVQALRADGADTALPQARFSGGGDATLHWRVRSGDVAHNLER